MNFSNNNINNNQQQQQIAQQREESAEQPTLEVNTMPSVNDELGPPKADFSAPPPYELTSSLQTEDAQLSQTQQSQEQRQQQHITQNMLVEQNMLSLNMHHGKLPTYEEVQLEKSLNGELPPSFISAHHNLPAHMQQLPPPPNPLLANIVRGDNNHTSPTLSPALTFIAIDPSESDNMASTDNSLLGTDIMFILAFMVAFLFNWIGFLILTCFCHTIAGRYGALSGFGLSLAKWTLIVKHSTDLASHENSWLWWLIMAFGFLVCIRSLIQYVSIKRTWRLLSTSAQERLLFFY